MPIRDYGRIGSEAGKCGLLVGESRRGSARPAWYQ